MRAKAQVPAPSAEHPPLEPLLTVADVAAHYQTGREEVHRWIRAGHLEVFRVGKFVRVRRDALDKFERRQLSTTRSKR